MDVRLVKGLRAMTGADQSAWKESATSSHLLFRLDRSSHAHDALILLIALAIICRDTLRPCAYNFGKSLCKHVLALTSIAQTVDLDWVIAEDKFFSRHHR